MNFKYVKKKSDLWADSREEIQIERYRWKRLKKVEMET